MRPPTMRAGTLDRAAVGGAVAGPLFGSLAAPGQDAAIAYANRGSGNRAPRVGWPCHQTRDLICALPDRHRAAPAHASGTSSGRTHDAGSVRPVDGAMLGHRTDESSTCRRADDGAHVLPGEYGPASRPARTCAERTPARRR